MSLMLINVSTRKFRRAVRLPEGDVPAPAGAGGVEVGGLAALRGVIGCAGKGHEELHRAIMAGQFMPSVPPPLIGLPPELQVRPPPG
jgi:hypothetical protein